MLLLGSRSITVEGITVFPDHADPDQFWYLPGPVQLADRPDGQKAFTFIQYRPAAVAGGAKGGGFLTFQVDLKLDKDTGVNADKVKLTITVLKAGKHNTETFYMTSKDGSGNEHLWVGIVGN